VIDCANGAASEVGAEALRQLGAEVHPIFDRKRARRLRPSRHGKRTSTAFFTRRRGKEKGSLATCIPSVAPIRSRAIRGPDSWRSATSGCRAPMARATAGTPDRRPWTFHVITRSEEPCGPSGSTGAHLPGAARQRGAEGEEDIQPG